MTLKEQFLELAFAKISSEELRDESIKIADDFAIGFSEWYLDLWNRNDSSFDDNSPQKLLEIYKREQGL